EGGNESTLARDGISSRERAFSGGSARGRGGCLRRRSEVSRTRPVEIGSRMPGGVARRGLDAGDVDLGTRCRTAEELRGFEPPRFRLDRVVGRRWRAVEFLRLDSGELVVAVVVVGLREEEPVLAEPRRELHGLLEV